MKRRGLLPLITIVLVAVVALGATLASNNSPQLGLDLQGGFSVVLTAKGDPPSDSIDKAKEIIRQRIDGLGVSEPEVTRQGDNVVVELPGVKDRKKAQQIVGQTAKLQFRPVLESAPAGYTYRPPDPEQGRHRVLRAGRRGPRDHHHDDRLDHDHHRAGRRVVDHRDDREHHDHHGSDHDRAGRRVVHHDHHDDARGGGGRRASSPPSPATALRRCACRVGPVGFEGSSLSRAKAELDTTTGSWKVAVAIKGSEKGTANELFNACYSGTPECPTKQAAIVLDGRVQSYPTVQGQNLADEPTFQITGDFSQSEAKDLALVLRYGALPVEFERSAEQQVSPTLGRASLDAGLLAGLIGLAAVAIYMLIYYRGSAWS